MSEMSFTDGKGRVWDLTLNLGIARRVDKSDFTFYYKGKWSFLRPEKEVMSAMLADNSLMFAIIFAIVIDQAKEKFRKGEFLFGPWVDNPDAPKDATLAFEQYLEAAEFEFAENITSESLETGKAAFWRSLVDFFREQKIVLDVLMRQYQKVRQEIDSSVKELEPEIQKKLKEALSVDMSNLRRRLEQIAREGSTPDDRRGVPST